MSRSRRRSKSPDASTTQSEPIPTPDSGQDDSGAAPQIPDVLMELTIAEQEAEELLAERRRQLEQAQATEWERWTSAMEAQLSAERDRGDQLEVALGRSELAHAEAKRRGAEADKLLAESRAEAEKRAGDGHEQLEEAHSRVQAQLARAESELVASREELADLRRELAQSRDQLQAELEETRAGLQGEVARVEKERDKARADLEALSTRENEKGAERIRELEAQLEAERMRVADLEGATELLESQRATAVRWAEEAQRAAREQSRRHSVGVPGEP